MVQASSSLLWPRSSVRKPSNNEETGDNGQMQDMMHSSGRAGSTSDSAAQDASYTQFSHANGPSPHDPAHKATTGASFTSSPLTQRPLSPVATSDDGGSDSSASTATAIDIPTRSGSHMPSNYPGPSLGMSYMHQARSFGGSSHRRTPSGLAFTETIHESSSEDEVDQFQRATQSKDGSSAFDALGQGSPLPQSNLVSPAPKYPTGLGISEGRRPHGQRRSLPASTSTSPMSTLMPGSSSFSPSSMKSFRRRSSGQHSPFAAGAMSTSPASPSPSLFSSSFVGSYEQSLLSGRMANRPSNATTPLPFTASLGVLGLGKNTPRALKCPDHVSIPFGAYFWDMDSTDKKGKGSPYVGTLDLTEYYMSMLERRSSDALTESDAPGGSQSAAIPRFPGYRIPAKGQIQLVIKNANQTAVKLFLVPYDLSDMPPGTKTFIRQKSYDIDTATSSESPTLPPNATSKARETLRYAIHLHFCAVPAKEKDRGRKKNSHASRRAPGLHHGHHLHQPYSQSQRTMSPLRQRDADSPARPASPHAEQRQRRPRSESSTASHIYLYKSIRVAFNSRALDLSEKLKTVHEGPSGLQSAPSSKDPPASNSDGPLDKEKYSTYSGPGEEWENARKARVEAEKAHERHVAQMQKLQLQFEDPVPFDPNGEFVALGKSKTSSHRVHEHPTSVHRNGFVLLNTPPIQDPLRSQDSIAGVRGRSLTIGSDNLMEAAEVPEPLSFQRSPVGRNVPLPSLLESGLSISRPGSRTRNHTTSPEKSQFGPTVPKEALR